MPLASKKYLDGNGLAYFARKLNDYPDNTVLEAVIEGIQDALDEKVNKSSQGAPGGVATLDDNGKVVSTQLPANVNTTYTLSQNSSDGHVIILSGSDGSTKSVTVPDNDTWNAMIGANSERGGTAGYVPAPPREGYDTKYLRADGTWAAPSLSTQYTPEGTISRPTFTGSSSTSTGTFTPSGTVSVSVSGSANRTAAVSTAQGETTYTPAGTVSAPSFTGTEASISSTAIYTPEGNVSLSSSNRTATVSPTEGATTYTPTGTVTAPVVSLASEGTTATVHNPASITVARSVIAAPPDEASPVNAITYWSITGKNLRLYQLGYTTGPSITTSDVTVKTGDGTYIASQPFFNGDGTRLVTSEISIPSSATFTGTEATISSSATYTPAGTNGTPSFSGTGVRLETGNIQVPDTYSATFTGTEGTVSVSGTPTGNVSQPTFTGTEATITVT